MGEAILSVKLIFQKTKDGGKMVRRLMLLSVMATSLMLVAGNASAQITKQSNNTGGGDWNTASTWNPSGVPGASDNVEILGGDNVTMAAAGTCALLQMDANSTLSINAAAVSIPGTSWNLASSSTVVLTGPTTVQTAMTYGNLTYSTTSSGGPAANTTLNIAGNLTVTASTFRGISATSGTNVVNVTGNVVIGTGTSARITAVNSTASTTASCTWNIGGSVSLTGAATGNRVILQESAGPHNGTSIINIGGNLNVSSPSEVQYRSSTTAGAGTGTSNLSVKGNIVISGTGTIQTATGGTGYVQTLTLNGTSGQQYTGASPNAFGAGQTLSVVDSDMAGVTFNSGLTLNTNVSMTVQGDNFTLTAPSGDVLATGTLSVSRTIPDNGGTNLPSALDDGGYSLTTRSDQYWTLSQPGFTTGTYNLSVDGGSQIDIATPSALRIVHSGDGGTTFDLVGTHSAGSGTVANRTAIPGATTGQFYLGGNMTDNPLPVQVTSFIAAGTQYLHNVTMTWKTGSEVNNAGFILLRRAPGETNFTLLSTYQSNPALKGLGTSTTGRTYSFTDQTASVIGNYAYELQTVSATGAVKNYGEVDVAVSNPTKFALLQNYPNPFNPSTTITYDVKSTSSVSIDVYDMLGQKVAELVNETKAAGEYTVSFDGSRLASGIYFYRMTAGNYTSTKRLVLVK
ncbi:MAG TPA: T9SS type A sorting domain-containing protein [Candidatus Acidoferrales bacterium]|nr:T9SS type A sorting domain-containing protein [Candidatus Acidoferrales bacterium]